MADLNEVYAALRKADAAGDTESANALSKYIRSQPSYVIPERTYGEVASDVGYGLASGLGGLAQFPGQVYGLATGAISKPDFAKTGLYGLGSELEKFGEAGMSVGAKAREEATQRKVEEATKAGGEMSGFLTQIKEVAKDPVQASNFLVKQLPQSIPSFVAALIPGIGPAAAAEIKGLQIAAKTAVGAVAKQAAKEALDAAVAKASMEVIAKGTKAAIGVGATQQGADIGTGSYEEVYKELIRKGTPEAQAAEKALGLARAAGASGAIISLLAQKLPGAQAMERAMAGERGKSGRIVGGVLGALKETPGEIVEETGGKFSQNLAMREVNPEQSLTAGLGATAGQAALGAVGQGGVFGAIGGGGKAEVPPVVTPPVAQTTPPVAQTTPPVAQITPPVAQITPVGVTPTPPVVIPPEPIAPTPPPPVDDEMWGQHKYTGELPVESSTVFQNRDRSTPASVAQMTSIAAKPDYTRLSTSQDLGSGAPVVISDIRIDDSQSGTITTATASNGQRIPVRYAVVEASSLTPSNTADGSKNPSYGDLAAQLIRPIAGNGRVAGLQAAYANKTADNYKKELLGDTSHGVDQGVISNMTNPVLVRIMPKSLVTPNIADITNISGVSGLSPIDAAKNDLRRMANKFDISGLTFNESGLPSREALNQFVAAMPVEEHGTLKNEKTGDANPHAEDRLMNAVFYKAYNSEPLIDLYASTRDPEAKIYLNALGTVAPKMAKLENAGDYDVRNSVVQAVEAAVNAKRRGINLSDFAKQGEIGMSPYTQKILQKLADSGRSGKKMSEALGRLADKAYEQTQVVPDMFGDAPKMSLDDVYKSLDEEGAGPDLFTPPEDIAEPKDFVSTKSREQIAKEVDGLTIEGLSQWTVDNAPNSAAKAVAEKVLVRIKEQQEAGIFKEKIKVKNNTQRFKNSRGKLKYTYGTQGVEMKIELNGLVNGKADFLSGTQYITILHELLHAATIGNLEFLKTASKEYNDLQVILNLVTKQIKSDLNAGVKHPILESISNGANTIKNVKELVAWGLTSPEFQDYLSKIKVGNTNAFNRLVQVFRKLLNIDVKYETALDAVVRTTDFIIETPIADLNVMTAVLGVPFSGVGVAPKKPTGVKPPATPPKPSVAVKPPVLDVTGITPVKGRNIQMQAAAKMLLEKKITREEFEKYVDYYKPIEEVESDKLRPPTSDEKMQQTVSANKRDKINAPISDGTKVGLRMDLPALERGGSVVSIHEGKPGLKTQGKLIGFRSTGYLKNVTFETRSQEKGLAVAIGEGKSPLQTMEGTWQNTPPQEAFDRVKKLMSDPAWTQVGFDPSRHGYFYDRKTRLPVVSADEVYQVGQFLLAKNVKNESKTKFLYERTPAKTVTDEDLIGDIKAKAQGILQKRKPLDAGAFAGVDAGLVSALSPVFKPQNKTIIDRMDGMKDGFWKKLAQGTVDQYRTIKDYSEVAYMQARLAKSVDGALEGLLFHGHVFNDGGALNIKQNTKGFIDALKPLGQEIDRFQIWVALNRDSQLPADKRSIDDALVARRGELSDGTIDGKPRIDMYNKILSDINAINKSVLDVALDAGLIDQDAYKTFSSDIFYIPFYKIMEEDGTTQGASTAAGLSRQQFSKALKGGEKAFGDLTENTLKNWSHILSASMKNQAVNSTMDAAMDLGAAVPNLKPGFQWINGKVYSLRSGNMVIDKNGVLPPGTLKAEYTRAEAGAIPIMMKGVQAHFKVLDPMLVESITSIGYMGPQSKFVSVARDFKNLLQFGVTISPPFKVRNLFRDSVQSMAISDLKKNPFANVVDGWIASNKNNPAHISALAGGAIFNFGSTNEGDQAKMIKRLIKKGVDATTILDSPEKVKNGLRMAWDKYQEFGEKSESANRMALYNQLRAKNASHLEASFQARDLLDFSMQGAWPAVRFLTQVTPFLNARMQGLYKLGKDGITPTGRVLYNTITGKPIEQTDKQKAASFSIVTGAVMLASLMLYVTFKDDEEFQKRDDWDRDNFWWIRLPGMEYALRIPKPFEIGAFGTMAERVAEQIMDDESEGKQFNQSLKRMLTDTFALNMPQVIKPLFDLYANKDSFTGSPIESAGMERLSKEERQTENTSPLAKALSKAYSTVVPEQAELSPVQTDYAIKAYFGWLGGTASWASHFAVMPFKDGEYPDQKFMDSATAGFIKTLPSNQSRYVTAFYENNREISQAYADMRHYSEVGDSEKVLQIMEEKGDKLALEKLYDKSSKEMANIRKQIRIVTESEGIDGATKRESIDRMKEIISMIAEQAERIRKSSK